jgi:hypothetical protein
MKQIAKQSLYLWILFPYLPIFLDALGSIQITMSLGLLIFVLSCFLHCKFVGVILNALFPHPSGSTSRGFALIGNLA